MAFLIDAGWAEVIIGVIALVASVVIYRITRKKKQLSYEILSETPLISVGDEIKGRLEILLDSSPVEKVHLLLVKFVNDGTMPITADDYERPLTLIFEGDATVLSAESVQPEPDNLRVTLDFEPKKVTVNPLLLNKGDSFTAKVLVEKFGGRFDLDARIVGVREVRALPKREFVPRFRSIKASVLILFALFVFGNFSDFLFNIAPSISGTQGLKERLAERERLSQERSELLSQLLKMTRSLEVYITPGNEINAGQSFRAEVKFREGLPSLDSLKYEWKIDQEGYATSHTYYGTSAELSPDKKGRVRVQLTVYDETGRPLYLDSRMVDVK